MVLQIQHILPEELLCLFQSAAHEHWKSFSITVALTCVSLYFFPLSSLNRHFCTVPACRCAQATLLLISGFSCRLTIYWLPPTIKQNGFSLIVQASFFQPTFVNLIHLLYLSFPLLPSFRSYLHRNLPFNPEESFSSICTDVSPFLLPL